MLGVVFFHDHKGLDGISRTTTLRVDHAMILYETGIINNVLCVGGCKEKKIYSGSYKMKAYLVEKGIPEDQILIDILNEA